jgi:hypothetical protein
VPYEDLIRDAQLGRASTKRFQEAAAMQKRVEAWVEEFNRDPVAAMAKIASGKEGAKFDEIVERYLYAKMQREKMTPEQRQAEERENEIRRLKAAEEARQKETESKSLEEARVKAQRILQGEISTAIEAIGLPKTPEVARRMAQLMLESHTRKDGLTSRQIASYLRTQLIEEHEALLSGLPPEEIATRFPKSAERIRQAEVARLKGGAPAPALNKPKPGERRQPTADEQARAQRGPNGYIRQREWEDAMKGR